MSRKCQKYRFRALRTLMFLLYYEGPLLERKKGGYLKVTSITQFALIVNVHQKYMKQDLEHLHSLGLILEYKKGYNSMEMILLAPRFI